MKTLLFPILFLSFLAPLFSVAQEKTPINDYLTLIKTKEGSFFEGDNGKQSDRYDYIFNRGYGFFEMTTAPLIHIDPNQIDSREFDTIQLVEECGYRGYSNDIYNRKELHVFELMKDLELIEDYGIQPYTELKWHELRDEMFYDFGYAKRNEKFALVSNSGEFLTDFIYDNPFRFGNNKPLINTTTKNGKLTTVVFDKFTGKEILTTEDSLVRYWDADNYLVKSKSGTYTLTYQAKKRKVPEIWSYVKTLSYESSLFYYYRYYQKEGLTKYENGWINLQGEKIKPENGIVPLTNFYKGYTLAYDSVLEEQEYFYNKPQPRRKIRSFKIINEQFETVKVLDEINSYGGEFNKYGQIIVNYKSEHSDDEFVIDYLGNYVIPPTEFPNRITQLLEGLYYLRDLTYSPYEMYQNQSNYYNQNGEKLFTEKETEYMRSFQIRESKSENYILSYRRKIITLDKENKVIYSLFR